MTFTAQNSKFTLKSLSLNVKKFVENWIFVPFTKKVCRRKQNVLFCDCLCFEQCWLWTNIRKILITLSLLWTDIYSLNHFRPIFHFCSPWKRQKTKGKKNRLSSSKVDSMIRLCHPVSSVTWFLVWFETHLDLIHLLITWVILHNQRPPWFDMVKGLLPNSFQLQACQQEELDLNQRWLERTG